MKRKSLHDPVVLKSMYLKNALIRSATNESMANSFSEPSEKMILLYEELARYVGLIITGFCYPSEDEIVKDHMLGLTNDEQIPAYQRLCKAVHAENSKILLQVVAGGNYGTRKVSDYTVDELQQLKQHFVQCAKRAEKAGFDGIQLHLAHGYLLSKFLSPKTNTRTDRYGFAQGKAARFAVEVLQELRTQLPEQFHISAKMHCSDFETDGMNMHEALSYALQFEQAGLDSLEISGGNYRKLHKNGFYYYEAQLFADALSIPVFAVGGNKDPIIMERQFQNSNLSALSVCRALINDPAFFEKGERSRCSGCGHCFADLLPCVQQRSSRYLLASDFDGTLCHDFHTIAAEDIQTIRTFSRKNLFGLVSGREPHSLFQACREHHIPYDFIIAFGGGIIYDQHGEILFEKKLQGPYDQLIEYLKQSLLFFTVYGQDDFWYYERVQHELAQRMREKTRCYYNEANSYTDLPFINIISGFCENEAQAVSTAAEIEKRFPQYQAVANVQSIDISAKGISKESALLFLMEHFKVRMDHMAAIGDSMNDISMIKRFNGFAIKGNPLVEQTARKSVSSVSQAIQILTQDQ